MMEIFVGLFTLLIWISESNGFDLETCRSPIGIETGKIPDLAFSASSHANNNTVAWKARVRSETDGWCPLNQISSTTYEYIQIDLDNLMVITLIELQGKFSFRPNEQFADAFRIEYRRNQEQKWIEYKDFSGQHILSGNSNSYIPTIRDILPSIIAKQIRIIPIVTGLISKYVCMRLELYGCIYPDGLISYSIPQGDKLEYDAQLYDEIYDGKNENGILKGGLGQLTDGILGQDDYRLTDNDQIGYDWVGWKRRPAVNLVFHFDTLRSFTSIRLHASNFLPHEIYLFRSIVISTCSNVNQHSMDFLVPEDDTNSSARLIQISFDERKNFSSNCLNITLTANNRSEWILISEVQFNSTLIDASNLTDNEIPLVQYWRWLLLIFSVCILVLISILIYQIQTYHRNYHSKCHLPPISCFNSDTYDLRHQLMISTTNSITSSDFSSTMNSYLTALSNQKTNLTTNPYSSLEMYLGSIQKTIQGPCGNSTYECLDSIDAIHSMDIPRWNDEQLIIGHAYSTMKGDYGMIFRGYLYLRHPYNTLKPILIKTLTANDAIQKKSFDQEHQLLNHLDHPNLVQFYGYTIEQNHALIEHSDLGDVFTCLSTSPNISINHRLYMITQLSNALCYLQAYHIVHRDIAARNCLIYPNYKIKLTNSALVSEQFRSHYYLINHRRLPIRWMPPESIINNEWTSQSDVWAFGITLWEVMTNCLTLPYDILSDDEVYQRLNLAEGLHLPKPDCLSREVIDLMLECWRPVHERPTFDEICMFFNKRLGGMDAL